jgi:hypothetical protein
MKIFRKLFTTLLILLFASCSKENLEKDIVGKWRLSEVSANLAEDYEPCDYQGIWEFKSDGKYVQIDACESEDNVDYGLWSIEDDRLTVIPDSFPIPFVLKIVILNKNTFKYEFAGEVLTFRKI